MSHNESSVTVGHKSSAKFWQNWMGALHKKWIRTQQYVRDALGQRRNNNTCPGLDKHLKEVQSFKYIDEINENLYNEERENQLQRIFY